MTALCQGRRRTARDALYATDAATAGPDELDAITEGGDYGSPRRTPPVAEVRAEEGGLGGCAARRRRCSSAPWTASGCAP